MTERLSLSGTRGVKGKAQVSLNVGFASAACSCPQHLCILLHNGNDCPQFSEFWRVSFSAEGWVAIGVSWRKRNKSENQVTDFGEETRNYLPSTPPPFI